MHLIFDDTEIHTNATRETYNLSKWNDYETSYNKATELANFFSNCKLNFVEFKEGQRIIYLVWNLFSAICGSISY